MMNAAVYDTFGGTIRVRRVPRPACPKDGVVVKVLATGVCRSDVHAWLGHDSDVIRHGVPFCPGHEFAGIIAESNLDPNNSHLRVGDRVVCPFILSCGQCSYCEQGRTTICSDQLQPGFHFWGSFAEYCAIPRAERHVFVLPTSVSSVQAAALGCRLTTAYRAIYQQAKLKSSESIAIFGCGGVGLSCVMLSKALGASIVVAVDVSPAALQLARSLGATHTILTKAESSTNNESKDLQYDIHQICPDGCLVCVDAAGFSSTCANAVLCTAPGGRMVQVGLLTGGNACPRIDMSYVAGKEIEIYGSHGFAAIDMPHLLELVASGQLKPQQLVQQEVSLHEGCQVLMRMKDQSPLGMTMITKFTEVRDMDTVPGRRRQLSKL